MEGNSRPQALGAVHKALNKSYTFLKPYLPLANTHGAEFITDHHFNRFLSRWTKLSLSMISDEELLNLCFLREASDEIEVIDGPPSDEDDDYFDEDFPKVKKVPHLFNFVIEARRCHLDQLEVLTPLEAVYQLEQQGPLTQERAVISEAMSEKKIHEVGVMVDAVNVLCRSSQSSMVVDIGSGKGYFASELSRKHKIPVVGFDSRSTNTQGATQRDRRLARKWTGLERRNKAKLLESLSTIDSKTNSASKAKNQAKDIGGNVLQSRSLHVESDSGAANPTLDNGSVPQAEKESADDLYVPVTMYVSPNMDLQQVIRDIAPHHLQGLQSSTPPSIYLSGLHTCGSLAATTQRIFAQDPSVVGMCCVGCCYQLMEEQFTDCHGTAIAEEATDSEDPPSFPLSEYGKSLGLRLGRNARNLASQSVHRVIASGKLQGGDFIWRAIFNQLLDEMNLEIPERIQGMRGMTNKCKTFGEYAAAALHKAGLAKHTPPPKCLECFEERFMQHKDFLEQFFQLKLVLAPVLEGLILLDRLAFLLEQEEVNSAYLVPLFDPVTSPRCYALISKKKDERDKL